MSSEPLEHATDARRSQPARPIAQRRALRYALAALPVGAMVAAVYVSYFHPWAWYGSRDGYQRHRTLTFTMPPDQVVYEEDPARAAGLLALPAAPRTAYVGGPRRYAPLPFEVPAGDYRPCGRGGACAEYVPRFHLWAYGSQTPGGLVFVHERVGPGGHRRRVMVTQRRTVGSSLLEPGNPNVRTGLELTARSSRADKEFDPLHGNLPRAIRIALRPGEVARIYAGQVDPQDGARFTVRYEVEGVPGMIEGRLGADDAVTMRVLDGPAVSSWKAVPRF